MVAPSKGNKDMYFFMMPCILYKKTGNANGQTVHPMERDFQRQGTGVHTR